MSLSEDPKHQKMIDPGNRYSEPLIQLPDPDEPLLSFTNLVEAHALKAIRRRHGVTVQRVRPALTC